MRISSNYFERFLFSTFPFILSGGLMIYIFKKPNVLIIIIPLTVLSVVILIIDRIPLSKTQLSKLTIVNDQRTPN